MAVYKRGGMWWYRFTWRGKAIRESTKQGNKRLAEQMEAAHKTSLAKGEVGIRDRKPVPTLKEFAEKEFKPFIESRFQNKPKTLEYYRAGIKTLVDYPPLAKCSLDAITTDKIGGFIAKRREDDLAVASINRRLEVLRRMQNWRWNGAKWIGCCRGWKCCPEKITGIGCWLQTKRLAT